MAANGKKTKLKEPVKVRTKKLADGSESYYLDIYVNGKRSYEFLKMYHLPEVNARVREQNRATREAVEAIKSQRIIEITNSKAGIKSKSAWQKLTLADWLEKFYAIQERKGIKRVEKLGSIIKIINQYGKCAVLAHPLLYKLGYNQIEELLDYLKPLGLKGLEAYHSSNNSYESGKLRAIADRHDLFVSGGTDFHGVIKPDISLGTGRGGMRITTGILDNIKAHLF